MLDTHVLLWWLQDSSRLGPKARRLIGDSGNDLAVSIASPWEMSVKHRLGKLADSGAAALAQLDALGIELVALHTAHLAVLEGLPVHHRDPFDHLIIAQAKAEGMTIMTDDAMIPRYAVPCIGVE